MNLLQVSKVMDFEHLLGQQFYSQDRSNEYAYRKIECYSLYKIY